MADGVNDSRPWLLGPPPDPSAKIRLFCFPYAGAGASVFHGWQEALPLTPTPLPRGERGRGEGGVAVCPVQPPGRENRLREPAFTAMAPLVQAAAKALRPYLRPPFALLGHSLGALVAFELARQLRREGAPAPACLFACGCEAPQSQQPTVRPIHALPREVFVTELRRMQGTPEAVLTNSELLDLFLPTLRADFAVLETYRCEPEEPLPCPVVAVGGKDDKHTSREGLAAWAGQTTGPFHLHVVPGGHFFLRTERTRLLHLLGAALGEML